MNYLKLSIILSLLLFQSMLYAQNLSFKNVSATQLPEVSTSNRNSMDAKVGDLDGDGDLDIIVGVEFYKNSILINDGEGNFSDGRERLPDLKKEAKVEPFPWYPYHDTEDIALEDFDRDGDLDIIFVTEDDQKNEFYLNDGKGIFSDITDQLPAEGISNGVLAGDFDADGWIDLVVGNNGQNIYLKNHKGKFKDETANRLPEATDITQDLQAVDFDQDGDLDILVANEKANKILLNNGKGVFEDVTNTYFSDDVLGEETREATFADIDNDGDWDIFFANVFMFQRVDPIQRLLVNDEGTFKDETQKRLGFADGYSIIDGTFHDLDQDNDQDLVLLTNEGPKILQNDGTGVFQNITEQSIGIIERNGVDTEIADFNGDGLLDIFVTCFRGGDLLLIQEAS